MDDFEKKVEELLKGLLSLKSGQPKNALVPTIKTPTIPSLPASKLSAPSMPGMPKLSSAGAPIKVSKNPEKIPGGMAPESKKDPVKVAEQLKNPKPKGAKVEVLKVEDNGQWSLEKADQTKLDKPLATTQVATPKSPGAVSTKVSGAIPPARMARIQANKVPVHSNESFPGHHDSEQNSLIHGLNVHDTTALKGGVAGGAQRAINPNGDRHVVLKRASDHADIDIRGHNENGFNSAKREVLFHNMARDFFGMGKHVPTTAGFSRNGEDYSAQEFKHNTSHADLAGEPEDSLDFESASTKKGEFKNSNHAKILNKLHESGDLHKLGMMDNIMGHHDRHAGNYMMDNKGDGLHLVDNGTSFDYKNFDTKHHPAYLDQAGDKNIEGMGRDNTTVHPEAAKWAQSLDPAKAKEILAAHGHDENSSTTRGFLQRLQGMKNALNNGQKHYGNTEKLFSNNRLTSGGLHQHENKGPQW